MTLPCQSRQAAKLGLCQGIERYVGPGQRRIEAGTAHPGAQDHMTVRDDLHHLVDELDEDAVGELLEYAQWLGGAQRGAARMMNAPMPPAPSTTPVWSGETVLASARRVP